MYFIINCQLVSHLGGKMVICYIFANLKILIKHHPPLSEAIFSDEPKLPKMSNFQAIFLYTLLKSWLVLFKILFVPLYSGMTLLSAIH